MPPLATRQHSEDRIEQCDDCANILSAAPIESIAQGIDRQMVVGKNIMICRLRFDAFVDTPVHSHPHEQMTFVVQGKVKFTIDGLATIAAPGDILHFPPDTPHGATMLDEEVVLIDIFSPIREDFLTD